MNVTLPYERSANGRHYLVEERLHVTEAQPQRYMLRLYGKGHWSEANGQPNLIGNVKDAISSGERWLEKGLSRTDPGVEEPKTLDTHGFIMTVGKHKGERITRVPISYLKWMVRERARDFAYAAAELERRGTVTPNIEISGHAIDSASLRCRKIWHATRQENEGLHAWLVRVAQEAIDFGTPKDDKTEWAGMLFVFERDGSWPLLKTIMRAKGGEHEASRKEEVCAD